MSTTNTIDASTTSTKAPSTKAPSTKTPSLTAEHDASHSPSDATAAGKSTKPTASAATGNVTSEPILSLNNVSYSYSRGGKWVLRNISHEFLPGKVYAITGPSGAGKTTLLSLISGLTSPTEGTVEYQGRDLTKQDRYRFRSHDIGVIFQSFNLLPSLTVGENIILSMDASGKKFDESKKEVALDMLDQVHLPREYMNERILHLSGGEQQRVAIARAFSYDPSIIVADEPTGNLDLGTQEDIMNIFRSLAHDQDRCVIIVTHSPQVARDADEVFALAPLRHSTKPARSMHRHARAK